ncbi:hypothetical protein B621_gp31 [Marinomonas phage P12026]|uniref:hypothetical protein n=1 Tax=Marinomonas phage P12026 TaxID=1176423 RepID=UPI0002688F49|nr:hypothetical protein B621_gp31 [Marinomonas phage P12026]AFM54877.1 hypothetical protein P12026_31 [Marinomonas phage P12026]
MSKIGVSLKINLSAIEAARVFRGQKGDYLDCTVFIDLDQLDQYGNSGMITQDVKKEEKDQGVKGPILGNCKVFWGEGVQIPQAQQAAPQGGGWGQQPPAQQPQPQSYGSLGNAPQTPPQGDQWAEYEAAGKAQGHPVEAVKKHPSVNGDLQKAIAAGLVVKKQAPGFDDFDDVPF